MPCKFREEFTSLVGFKNILISFPLEQEGTHEEREHLAVCDALPRRHPLHVPVAKPS